MVLFLLWKAHAGSSVQDGLEVWETGDKELINVETTARMKNCGDDDLIKDDGGKEKGREKVKLH